MHSMAKNSAQSAPLTEAQSLKRLEFEMALKIGGAVDHTPAQKLHKAAAIADGEVIVVLPTGDGKGAEGIVRLNDRGTTQLLMARILDSGFVISEESDIDADLLGFARTSVALFDRLRADRAFVKTASEH
jgi:hypothetical protein